jgi:hypothetical protein
MILPIRYPVIQETEDVQPGLALELTQTKVPLLHVLPSALGMLPIYPGCEVDNLALASQNLPASSGSCSSGVPLDDNTNTTSHGVHYSDDYLLKKSH